MGYLVDGNDEVIEVVIDDDGQTQTGYIGWIVLTTFMGITALAIVCLVGKYCETKTHVPLTVDKKDDKSFIERRVYGVLSNQINANNGRCLMVLLFLFFMFILHYFFLWIPI